VPDFFPKDEETLIEGLRPGRTSGHVNVHGDDPVDALEDVIPVVPIRSPAGRTAPHRDDVLGLGHLLVETLDPRGHLDRHRAGDDHQVRLPGRGPKDAGPKAVEVRTGRDRHHHLDGTAGQTKGHRPQGRKPRPVEYGVDRRQQDKALSRLFETLNRYGDHRSTPRPFVVPQC
jgi:hypothetical protein